MKAGSISTRRRLSYHGLSRVLSSGLRNPRLGLIQTHSTSDHQDATCGSWNRTLYEKDILLGVNANDFQGTNGYPLATHAAAHAFALFDFWTSTKVGTVTTNGTRMAVLTLHAVARFKAAEVIPLHDALKTFAFACAGDVDELRAFQARHVKRVAKLNINIVCAEFAVHAKRAATGAVVVPNDWHRTSTWLHFFKAKLHSAVAINFVVLHLRHNAWPSLNHSDRNIVTVLHKEASHTDFSSNEHVHH
jgi:hypothetical protein